MIPISLILYAFTLVFEFLPYDLTIFFCFFFEVTMAEADFKLDNRIVAMRAFETMDTLLKITDEIKQISPTNLKISVSSPDSNYNYVRTHHMFSRILYFLLSCYLFSRTVFFFDKR